MISSLFVLARVSLLLALAASPWMLGAVPVRYQLAITALIGLALILWALGTCLNVFSQQGSLTRPIPVSLTALVAFAALGTIQLLPSLSEKPIHTAWSATVNPDIKDARAVPSIVPTETRFQVARLIVLGVALFLSSQLFVEASQRNLLYGTLAITGASIALFGMTQKLTWNGELFWTIPLRFGGQPFAAFVNRNNASGFLNLCLAGCLGGIVLNHSAQRSREHVLKMAFSVMAVITACGVIAAMSRGGIGAALIAFVVVLPRLASILGKSFWMGLIGTCFAVAVISVWLGFQSEALGRMKTLDDIEQAMGIRVTHWQDTAPAIQDRLLLGSGLGTYKHVNRPYQNHVAPGAFWNADNMYYEIAVEAGIAGLLLTIYLLSLVSWELHRLWKLGPFSDRADVAVLGLFAFLAVAIQQVTDFGITVFSLGLVASVFLGMISSAVTADLPHFQFDSFSRYKALLTAIVMLVVTGLAGYELSVVEASATFQDQLPLQLDEPDVLNEVQVSVLIQRGEDILKKQPTDSQLMYSIAKLLMYRYRVESYQNLKKSKGTNAWEQTQLENIYRVANLAPDESVREQLRNLKTVKSSLIPAYEFLKRSQRQSNWLKGLHYDLALLSFIQPNTDPSGVQFLQQGASLDANDPNRLMNTARLAISNREPHSQHLGVRCLQRAILLKPEIFPQAVQIARVAMDDLDICSKLLKTAEQLIAFAQQTSDPLTLSSIAERLKAFLNTEGHKLSAGEAAWISANVSSLNNEPQAAIQALQTAVEESPLNVEWRLKLARMLMECGDFEKAKEHLSFARKVAPQRRDIEMQLKQAIEGRLPQQNSPLLEKSNAKPRQLPTIL